MCTRCFDEVCYVLRPALNNIPTDLRAIHTPTIDLLCLSIVARWCLCITTPLPLGLGYVTVALDGQNDRQVRLPISFPSLPNPAVQSSRTPRHVTTCAFSNAGLNGHLSAARHPHVTWHPSLHNGAALPYNMARPDNHLMWLHLRVVFQMQSSLILV